MTDQEWNRAKQIKVEIEKEVHNVDFLCDALLYRHQRKHPIQEFLMYFLDKEQTKLHLGGEGVAFGGYLLVDRDFLEYARDYFIKKREALVCEFEKIGRKEIDHDTKTV